MLKSMLMHKMDSKETMKFNFVTSYLALSGVSSLEYLRKVHNLTIK